MTVTPYPTTNSTGNVTLPMQSDSNHGGDIGQLQDDDISSEADTAVMSDMEDGNSDSELIDEIEASVPAAFQALRAFGDAALNESNVQPAIDAGSVFAISRLAQIAVNPAQRTIFLRVADGWSIAKLVLRVLNNLSTHTQLHWIHSGTRPLFSTRCIRNLVNLSNMLLEELNGPNQFLKNEARSCVAVAIDTLGLLVLINRYAGGIFDNGGVVTLVGVVLCGSHLVHDKTRKRAAAILSMLMTGTSRQTQARAAAVIAEMVDYRLFIDFGNTLYGEDDRRTAPAVQVLSDVCRCVQNYDDADAITLQVGAAMLRYAVDGKNASLVARVVKALYDLLSSANADTFEMINALDPLISVLHGSRDGVLVLVIKILGNVLPLWLVDDVLLDQVQTSSIVNGLVNVLQTQVTLLGFIAVDMAISMWESTLFMLRVLTESRPSFVYQIKDAGGICPLAVAMRSSNYSMRLAAAEILENCAAVPHVLDVSATKELLYPLTTVSMDPADGDELTLIAARAVENLSKHSDGRDVVAQAGGISVLISCAEFSPNNIDLKISIMAALANFISEDELRKVFIGIQATQVVIDLARTCRDLKLRLSTLSIIERLAYYSDGLTAIASTGHAIPFLIDLLRHPTSTTNSNLSTISIPANTSYAFDIDHEIRMKLMRTLCELIEDPVTQAMIEAAGAVQVLQQLQLHGREEQQMMAAMILHLLNFERDN
jgi:hypothetical protein